MQTEEKNSQSTCNNFPNNDSSIGNNDDENDNDAAKSNITLSVKRNQISMASDETSSMLSPVSARTITYTSKNTTIEQFSGDLKLHRFNQTLNTSTPAHTPKKIASNPANTSYNRDFSPMSVNTPNRSAGGASSHNSYSFRSTPSFPNNSALKSFDNSFPGSPDIVRLEKSRDRRNLNSSVCLGDFIALSPATKQKGRKSYNSSFEVSPTQQLSINRSSDQDFPTFTPRGNMVKTLPSQQSDTSTPKVKPVKRVVPTLISSNRNEFSYPAFRSENNILEVNHEEADITRDVLKTQRDAIKQVFADEPSPNLRTALKDKLAIKCTNPAPPIDLTKITHKPILDKFIHIYVVILDLNLVTNVLAEISFLVNLVNSDTEEYYDRNPHLLETLESTDEKQVREMLLKYINNCVYFGLGVLKLQKIVLRLLDTTTLKVLLENERLTTLDADIRDLLKKIYTHKVQLESIIQDHNTSFKNSSSMKVFYQQDDDTRDNFPSPMEFATFKKQRDGFYSIMSIWKSKHLNPSWNFELELGQRVRSLLNLLNHPINMAHLAKLFTSQLLLSCNFNDKTPELQLDLPNIDPSKLSKLQQRLVAPSNFSTNFQFPGNQIFFKDFISAASDNLGFMEQLKIVIINELVEMNDSSYETLNLSTINVGESKNSREYIVKPETLSTLSVLAKFLGLIIAYPYQYEFGKSQIVDARQIELRNKVRVEMDIKDILRKSIINQKLIITLPWIVQYIAMLDSVTLNLNYYREVFQMLYELYMMTINYGNAPKLIMRPTSLFIVRSCLGWLFEQPQVPNEYYNYRRSRKSSDLVNLRPLAQNELTSVQIFVPSSISSFFQEDRQIVLNAINADNGNQNSISGTLEKYLPDQNKLPLIKTSADDSQTDLNTTDLSDRMLSKFDPLLESVLTSACPFLADFRVSIMPRRSSKVVSRTGRYRHVTTRIYESTEKSISKTCKPDDNIQTRLIEAFLHSQSLSVRRTVEFVSERTFSNVIKDFQVKVIIPLKKAVTDQLDSLRITDNREALNEISKIYIEGEKTLLQKWNELIEEMANERIKMAFGALLPYETLDIVKDTCIKIVLSNCKTKTNEWRLANLKGIEIFTKDIDADAEKVVKKSFSPEATYKNEFDIDLDAIPPWKTFQKLQMYLHTASLEPQDLKYEMIIDFVNELFECMNKHVLPDPIYRTIAIIMVHLFSLIVSNRHDLMRNGLIKQFIKFWKHEKFSQYTIPPTDSDANTVEVRPVEQQVLEQQTKEEQQLDDIVSKTLTIQEMKDFKKPMNYIFSMLLTPGMVFLQYHRPKQSFEVLGKCITELINNRLVNIHFINEQCVKLLREEWEQDTLNKLSCTMQYVLNNCKSINTADNDIVFLETLAHITKNLENF